MADTPKIRFKGFADAWEQRKLGEVADIVGGGTPSTGKDKYWDGDIDWYSPAEIADQIYVYSSERKITEEGFNNSSARMLPVGAVLFTSRAGIGKMAILCKESCTNQGFQSIVPHENELDSYFIYSRSEELKRYGETVGAGSTFVEVSGKQMAAMDLMMPPTIEEQRKIGRYFEKIDRLITLHRHKCDETKELKRYMLQKMFPRNGKKNPEIRFAGFTDDWEQRKLGDITGNVIGGGTPKTSVAEYWDGSIPWIQSSNVQENEMFEFEIPKSITQLGLDKSATKLIPKNSIAVVTHVGVGKLIFVPFSYATSQDFTSLTELKTDAKFTCYSLYRRIQNDLHIVQGSAIKGITKEDLLTKEIMVPEIEEQKKIGEYFRNLDHLITLHQRKCDELKEVKKFMLQNMFPQKG